MTVTSINSHPNFHATPEIAALFAAEEQLAKQSPRYLRAKIKTERGVKAVLVMRAYPRTGPVEGYFVSFVDRRIQPGDWAPTRCFVRDFLVSPDQIVS